MHCILPNVRYFQNAEKTSGKYPTIEVCMSPHKEGKERKHTGILGPRNISISGHIHGCTNGGGFVRYWNACQKSGC